jgi:hypothetical protein
VRAESLLAAWLCVTAAPAHAGRIAFLAAEFPNAILHNDSFVVTIDDADAPRLEHARRLVDWIAGGGDEKTSPDRRIVVTDIAPGADGINRDWRAPGAPAWSWHAIGEAEFVDFTIEILDGWPTFVEQDVPGWMANTGGRIGFWSYTLVAELGPGSAGDFNGDGSVDGWDLLAWQRGFGGAYDGGDLADWEHQFGRAGAAASATALPEPASLVLLALAASSGWRRRRAGLPRGATAA